MNECDRIIMFIVFVNKTNKESSHCGHHKGHIWNQFF